MEDNNIVQLSKSELSELIQAIGFRPYSETFFSKFAILIKEEVLDKYPKTFKCFYITFFMALIINIAIAVTLSNILIKYLEPVRWFLSFILVICWLFLFAASVIRAIIKVKFLIADRYAILRLLYDITTFALTAVILSISFVAYIDLIMQIGFGIVKSIVIKFQLDPFNSFPSFVMILVTVAMFMIVKILQTMLIPSNIRVKIGMYLVLYIINLLIVIAYVSKEFFNYVDLELLALQNVYYYDVFCQVLICISINYIVISFYSKINYLYNNVNLNNLCLRLNQINTKPNYAL
jgi:hypothetical protein